MLLVAAGRGQHFQARGRSFSLYGPVLSRQITYLFFFPAVNWLTSGFVYATLSLNWLTCRVQTSTKNLKSGRASNSDTIQRKMYERTYLFRTYLFIWNIFNYLELTYLC